MTGTNVARFTHKSVQVIFEPTCTKKILAKSPSSHGFQLKLDVMDKPAHLLWQSHQNTGTGQFLEVKM